MCVCVVRGLSGGGGVGACVGHIFRWRWALCGAWPFVLRNRPLSLVNLRHKAPSRPPFSHHHAPRHSHKTTMDPEALRAEGNQLYSKGKRLVTPLRLPPHPSPRMHAQPPS